MDSRAAGRGMGRGRIRTRSPSGTRGGTRSSAISESTPSGSTSTTGAGYSDSLDTQLSSMQVYDTPSVATSSDILPLEVQSQASLPRGATRGRTFHPSSAVDTDVDVSIVRSRPEGKPKTGKKGQILQMRSNFFTLTAEKAWSLYQYHVDFVPEEDRTKVKKILFRDIGRNLGIGYMFDGMQLFTSKHLTNEGGQPLEEGEVMTYQTPGFKNRGKPNEEQYDCTITVKFVKKLNPGSPVYAQLYNVLIKKCLFTLELEMMGRNFFDPKAAIKLPQERLELWPGYVTSMRTHENETLLCVEVTHKVIRTDSVLELINQIKTKKGCGNDRGALSAAVNGELKDTIVMTTYNRKTYHVDDVDCNLSPKSTFSTKDGGSITYAEYYKNRYGLEIRDMNQPLLLSKPKKTDIHRGDDKPVYLIPELCQSTGLTDDMRADFRLMKKLSEYLHQGPQARVKEIEHFMRRLLDNPTIQEELRVWGLEFRRELVSLTGRIMPSETMIFAKEATQPVDAKGDFTLAFRSKQMLSSVNLENWVILVPQRDASGVDNLVRTMSKVAGPLSMRVANPKEVVKMPDTRVQTYLRTLEDLVKKNANLQMLFVILPNNKLDLYAAVKKRLAVDAGIPSQCFLAKNVGSKGLMSIATKVVVQMNAKLGGEPWTIKLPLKNTMFVGFDVYHGAKGSKGGSIGAMVATFSPHFTKYFSTTSTYHSTDDLSKNMRIDLSKCLDAFHEENGILPERIIMYRDGVGEGQLKYVYDVELAEIQNELRERYKTAQDPVKLTFVVVTKKINTRVFAAKQGGQVDNPPPGTVVDTVVTLPERLDFYLISCAARQGTVSPCSYNVLADDSNFEPDRIQQITYKLCHMYFNWSGTIAVPAPCQYAHKLAFLTGMAYAGHANHKLRKLLHFL